MINLDHAPPESPGAVTAVQVARNSRRQPRQTAMQRREEEARSGGPSTLAEIVASSASVVLPRKATQRYIIYSGTAAIYEASSARASYTISKGLIH